MAQTTLQGTGNLLSANRLKSARFTTGANTITLASVGASLTTNTGAAVVGFGIYSDNAGNPGAQLADFGTVSFNSGATVSEYTLALSGSYTLAANTVYHLRTYHVSGSPDWRHAFPNTMPTAQNNSNIVHQTYRQSNNGGTTWFDGSAFANRLQLNGTVNPVVVVPEAGSLVLIGVGCSVLGAGVVRRRTK